MNQSRHFNRVIKENAIYIPPLVPKEYQRVEYIEANGNQYINTGVQPTDPYIKCKFKTNNTSFSAIFGTNVASAWAKCSMTHYNGNMIAGTDRENNLGSLNTDIHYAEYNTPEGEIKIDGVVKLTDFTVVITAPIIIGGRGNGYSGTVNLRGRIYEFSIYDNSTSELVFNGIPCYRKSDSAKGMYDTVTKAFFGNAGSGSFTVGANV